MKKTLLFILSLVVGITLFIGVLQYIGWDEVRKSFSTFSWSVIGAVIALGLLQMAVLIYRWQLILEAQGDRVPYRKLLAPKFVGYTISFLTPGLYVGGEPVRAYLLKKTTKVRLSHGMASIMVDKILDFTYPLPFLVAALIYAIFEYNISWGAVSIFVLALIVLIGLLILFYIQTYRGKGFFSMLIRIFHLDKLKVIRKYLDKFLYFEKLIITFFNKKPKLFIEGLLLSLLGGVLVFVQFYVILYALGITAGLWQILVMMVFMILAFLVPIPASLGSLETGQAIVFSALKYTPSLGIAFSLVLRVVELVKVGIGLMFLSNIGLRFLKDITNNNHDESNITQ